VSEIERLRALAKEAMARRAEATARPESAALVWDAGRAEMLFERAASATIALALLDVADASLAYLASDGSGIRAKGRWSAPFDAMDHARALGRLRKALDRLGA